MSVSKIKLHIEGCFMKVGGCLTLILLLLWSKNNFSRSSLQNKEDTENIKDEKNVFQLNWLTSDTHRVLVWLM